MADVCLHRADHQRVGRLPALAENCAEGAWLLDPALDAEEAVALLTAPQCPSGVTTVILDPSQLYNQVHESCGHPTELDRVFGTEASYAGTSFLTPDKTGKFQFGSKIVNLVADRIIPAAAAQGLARFCDVFVEESAFTVPEARRILEAARAHGMGLKLHADQLSSSGGAELAGELGAVSADHLEQISTDGIGRMVSGGVVAVSLPFASLYLGMSPMPARQLIGVGIPVAVATDFNPGSAPSYHLPLALTLACLLQKMTPAEALKGATVIAARAVGLEAEVGSLEPGKSADFAVIDAPGVTQWLYHLVPNACVLTVVRGGEVWRKPADRLTGG